MMTRSSALCALLVLAVSSLCLAQFTVLNGSFEGDLYGWDGTTVEGRENGPFPDPPVTEVTYQAINSPNDPVSGSGSILFDSKGYAACSLTQQLGITGNDVSGATLTIYADVAWDGNWDFLYFGFYEDNAWDRVIGASVNVADLVTPDTDGTLNTFTRLEATGPVPLSDNPLRVFIGTSCDPWGNTQAGQCALDYVSTEFAPPTPTPTATPPSSASFWCLYE